MRYGTSREAHVSTYFWGTVMELKWLMIAFAVIMSSIAIGASVEKYADKQCRIAAIANQVPATEIDKACGTK